MNHRATKPSFAVERIEVQQYGPDHTSATEDKAERQRRVKNMIQRAKQRLPLSEEKR